MAATSGNRVSIYVPADLKRRMDKTKEDVNWSTLACAAFEMKLGEIATKKEKKNMDDVIQRLRAAKLEEGTEAYTEGVTAGRSWASDEASPSQLNRLSRFLDGIDFESWVDGNNSAFSIGQLFAFEILGTGEDRNLAASFWQDNVIDDRDYLRGFAAGAMDIWQQVKSRI